ncbi:MAG: D-glycero-beta-D-manno-heptose-7-phosphate kinase [Candidatus Omnitrophica bacterium]|nr:D-glycero-beta-D-manno-heptose-7-phosphate kinase [Candidatus Omnitrophota bacterium]
MTDRIIPDWILKDKSAIRDVIGKFRNKRILVVGDLILDQFIWGDVSRISPEAPVPVVWVKRESYMPGGACNVAHNLSDLGAEATVLGIIGDDANGKMLLSELSNMGVDISKVVFDNSRPTTHKVRVIAHSQQVVRIDREELGAFPARLMKAMVETIEKEIKIVDAIIIEDYGKGLITPVLVKKIVELGKKYKKIINVDPKKEHFKYYKGITTITPNKSETEEAVGITIKDDSSLKKAAQRLLKQLNARSVLITLGERGMCLMERGRPAMHIPTMARQVYDVSGAGDTVIASYTLAVASGASQPQAAYIANQAAGVVVGKIGTATITKADLLQEISKWK